ncbi:CrcB protein [Actinopolyspora alba]|uniref:Fluoride-specific ion channel FluC n=1 Tax=Actinopolyspora alba TaxID=673379 RepID=A0A1I2BX50_9ACTN|nr:CrcB family protein [Actinopolyspora alba]SFE60667.1 CrcB protein [Actinopolyspora alba]
MPNALVPHRSRVLAAVALGGALGSSLRYGVSLALPHADGGAVWPTLTVNVLGCLVIGVFTVFLEAAEPHHLLRPFFGVGVLGGFTTFSSYLADAGGLLATGQPFYAALYLLLTVLLALPAVICGAMLARMVVARSRRSGPGASPDNAHDTAPETTPGTES